MSAAECCPRLLLNGLIAPRRALCFKWYNMGKKAVERYDRPRTDVQNYHRGASRRQVGLAAGRAGRNPSTSVGWWTIKEPGNKGNQLQLVEDYKSRWPLTFAAQVTGGSQQRETSVQLKEGGRDVCLVALRWLMGQTSSLGGHAYRARPGGGLPAVHQEQLNTAHAGVQ
ncbi:unnamed protein product [Pleuronectes platessa]|uniref:Uncharacterized protein n=1 Tax=Pleuronectes platessa TaxID=8262 RepID=A0A9N7VPD3_PLEPL|nr:unnamed protein product [Pleuronectes platessa]